MKASRNARSCNGVSRRLRWAWRALTVAVGVVVDWDIALFGLVVVALGVGNVLAHFLGAKEQKTDGQ